MRSRTKRELGNVAKIVLVLVATVVLGYYGLMAGKCIVHYRLLMNHHMSTIDYNIFNK
jgi:hypothetical protein